LFLPLFSTNYSSILPHFIFERIYVNINFVIDCMERISWELTSREINPYQMIIKLTFLCSKIYHLSFENSETRIFWQINLNL
jgi:hypothetical protein